MMNGRIGFVSISHPDYLNDIVIRQTDIAAGNITDNGFEIESPGYQVIDFRTALDAGRFLASRYLDGVVIFLASWIECPSLMTVLREIEHLPFCLQAFKMVSYNNKLESTGSYVSYAMIKGSLDRTGYSYSSILAETDSIETKTKINDFCIAARARMLMRRSRIGLVGYTSMSIYTGTFDHVLLRKMIGPEVVQFDSYTVINIAEKCSLKEKESVLERYNENASVHSEVRKEALLKSSGIYLSMKSLAEDHGLDAINMKCQYEFSKEYKMVPCVPLSLIAEDGIVASCEGDMLNTVSMLIMHYLTDTTVTYGDIMNNSRNVVKLSTCGFLPFSMGNEGSQMIRNFMPHPGFNGIQCSFTLRPGIVTVMRLIEDKCSYHILYFTGEGLETELRQEYMPALDVRIDGDIEKLLSNLSGQHYAICYGDISDKIEEFAQMTGIRTIRI
jgi:L-fucose isomerase-like protein